MRLVLLAFTGGALCGLAPPAPAHATALLLLAAALALALRRHGAIAGAFFCGLAWSGWSAEATLADWLAPALEDEAVAIGGAVASFPQAVPGAVLFELADVELRGRVARLPGRIRLDWATAQPPRLGDWCELRVRLRRPHGLANPGGREREVALLVRHVGATGRVIVHPANLCTHASSPRTLAGLRAGLAHAIARAVPSAADGAVLRALAVDDRSGLARAQWEVMRRTGTAHLIAISGLQVTLVAGWAFVVGRYGVGGLCARQQRYDARRAGWFAAGAAACAYTAVAGAGVPSVRAAVMAVCGCAAALGGRRALGWDTLLASLALLVLLDPVCLLGAGLWLSYLAVAVLIAATPLLGQGWRGAWRMHLVMACALAPLTAVLFGEIPLAAPFANLVAVPWCNLLVVPLTVVGMLCASVAPGLSAVLWDSAARLWAWLYLFLGWLAAWPTVPTWQRIDVASAALGCLGLALLALPRALGLRVPALALLGSLALPRTPPLRDGAFEVVMFDVGQGLSVLVRTASHAVLYDSGPRWWDGSGDAGESVVVPALRALGVYRLDRFLVSHADVDHAGGAASILAALPVAELLLAEPLPATAAWPSVPCRWPARWRYDGVEFRVLQPRPGQAGRRNARSCVLAIAGRHGRALLTGDLEQAEESTLLAADAAALAADVISVPHHGSTTSSSPAFVTAVGARVALIGNGYRNRFGLPHAAVVARWRAAGADVRDTAHAGALTVRVDTDGIAVHGWRASHWGFWRGG